jgi:hypothetical protein
VKHPLVTKVKGEKKKKVVLFSKVEVQLADPHQTPPPPPKKSRPEQKATLLVDKDWLANNITTTNLVTKFLLVFS